MIPALIAVALVVVLTLGAYADRVYSEMGKFLTREYQDNLDSWVDRIEPRFGLSRDSMALSAAVVRLIAVAALSLLLGSFGPKLGFLSFLERLLEVALLAVIFDRLVPQVLFARTRGLWVSRLRWVYLGLFYLVLPITLLIGLLLSIAALAELTDEQTEESQEESVDALLEAGEEEGILEKSDRSLLRAVVEFGDMVVREVMTPRPEIFAVPDSLTLAEFTDKLNHSAFSRVPVYSGTLDNITGIAFSHDLLQITDAEAKHRTVRDLQRPAVFTPEPKPVNDLLREMQSKKQHMRIVIDEYGSVAGLVTIEDLIEAIVGNIEDEHETASPSESVERVSEDTWIVPGSLDLTELRGLLAARTEDVEDNEAASPHERRDAAEITEDRERNAFRLPANIESSTVGGLVSELAGHIPLPGEVVESEPFRMEVLSSTARLVTRVRISLLPPPE